MKAEVLIAETQEKDEKAINATGQKWFLTQTAFDGLLACLDSNRDIAADRYLRMRRDLVRLFEWRGCCTPDDYAHWMKHPNLALAPKCATTSNIASKPSG